MRLVCGALESPRVCILRSLVVVFFRKRQYHLYFANKSSCCCCFRTQRGLKLLSVLIVKPVLRVFGQARKMPTNQQYLRPIRWFVWHTHKQTKKTRRTVATRKHTQQIRQIVEGKNCGWMLCRNLDTVGVLKKNTPSSRMHSIPVLLFYSVRYHSAS